MRRMANGSIISMYKGFRMVTGRAEDHHPKNRNMSNYTPGLSTVHNRTLSSGIFWLGAGLVKVTRNYDYIPSSVEHKRGVISGFSKGSRKRLMRKLAKINNSVLPLFVTLTFPDEFFEHRLNTVYIKQVLRRFELRFRRAYPNGSYIWREEYQDRKSGRYVGEMFPHFHLLVYGVDHVELRKFVTVAWWEACGKLSQAHLMAGTQVSRVENKRHLMGYVSKYIAKVEDKSILTGRVWGICNVENIPFVKGILIQLSEKEAVQLVRYFRRYARIRGRDYKSLTVFTNPDYWYERIDRLLYPI